MDDAAPAARDASTLVGADLETAGVVFQAGDLVCRTTGERVGAGGMGNAWYLDVWRPGDVKPARGVGKTFRWEYLVQLARDPEARRHYEHNLEVLERIQKIRELHLLPVLLSRPLRDNHLVVMPYGGDSMVSLVASDEVSPRDKVSLLIQAVRGLRALHDHGIVHGDFTLRNVLVTTRSDGRRTAVLFDFDLSLALDRLGGVTYAQHYRGRIVGSPEYSLTPEQLDPVLERLPVTIQRDIYAVGTALYALFTDASVYGDVADLPALLEAIAEGVVRQGRSRVRYPDTMPEPLRDVVNTCLERDPAHRFQDSTALIRALELALQSLGDRPARRTTTLAYVQVPRATPRDAFPHAALARHGYVLERSLGRVKEHAIYLAQPDPDLVATGRFPEVNAYRKIVTAIPFAARPDADAFLEEWVGRIVPVLEHVRRGFLTALYRVVVDRPSGHLLLFSEYLDDPRFGTDLEPHELALEEALALGLIIAHQVSRLHAHGLAHNNVTLRSLLFKRLPDSGQVRAVFVGLVDPSFAPDALADDVRRLAGMIRALIRPGRLTAAEPAARPALLGLVAWLDAVELGDVVTPTIGELLGALGDGLARVERNFDVVRRYGGDPIRFAELLIRHSLYRYLWA